MYSSACPRSWQGQSARLTLPLAAQQRSKEADTASPEHEAAKRSGPWVGDEGVNFPEAPRCATLHSGPSASHTNASVHSSVTRPRSCLGSDSVSEVSSLQAQVVDTEGWVTVH